MKLPLNLLLLIVYVQTGFEGAKCRLTTDQKLKKKLHLSEESLSIPFFLPQIFKTLEVWGSPCPKLWRNPVDHIWKLQYEGNDLDFWSEGEEELQILVVG